MGPAGPQGEVGLRGEAGPPREGVIIERQLLLSLYDEDGYIFIEDNRITPITFRAIYLKVVPYGSDVARYIPLDYAFPGYTVFIAEGMLWISDPDKDFLDAVVAGFFFEADSSLAILVSH